jgi:hypothetical protein
MSVMQIGGAAYRPPRTVMTDTISTVADAHREVALTTGLREEAKAQIRLWRTLQILGR